MKNIKLLTLLIFTILISLTCSSCKKEDRMMERFDKIDASIENNNSAILENGKDIQNIYDFMFSKEKTIEKIKNEQIGLALSSYFDSYARQPEIKDALNEAKDLLINSINSIDDISKIYGIALLFGAKSNENRYVTASGDGIFESIARHPEIADGLIEFTKNVLIESIKDQQGSASEMIGFSSATLFEAAAREPEILDNLFEYSEYIINSFPKLKNSDSVYALGYASCGFYDAVARQVGSKDDMFNSFKAYIETLINE